MNNFNYYNPVEVLFGKGVISTLGSKFKSDKVKKVLLILGSGSSKRNGVYAQVTSSLEAQGIQWTEVDQVQANPTLEKVNKAIAVAKEAQVDAILAVGGGSVIDTAKTVAAGFCSNEPCWELFNKKENITAALPLYTVLTISATGSEMNEFAVISNEALQLKWSIYGEALFPKTSFIDPSVQASLPWFQTVNGAVDAISHIMEQYFTGSLADTTMGMAESVIKSIITATDQLQNDQLNYTARANLAWASSLALNGLFRTGTGTGDWGTHYIEHGMSAIQTEIAHGAGLAVLFPAWILHVGDYKKEAFKRWSNHIWGCDSLELAVEKFRIKLKAWGHPINLNELGIKTENIEKMIETSCKLAVGRIKVLDSKDLQEIYFLAK